MCAIRFIRLEEFIDRDNGMIIHLEPQGLLFAHVCLFFYLISFIDLF